MVKDCRYTRALIRDGDGFPPTRLFQGAAEESGEPHTKDSERQAQTANGFHIELFAHLRIGSVTRQQHPERTFLPEKWRRCPAGTSQGLLGGDHEGNLAKVIRSSCLLNPSQLQVYKDKLTWMKRPWGGSTQGAQGEWHGGDGKRNPVMSKTSHHLTDEHLQAVMIFTLVCALSVAFHTYQPFFTYFPFWHPEPPKPKKIPSSRQRTSHILLFRVTIINNGLVPLMQQRSTWSDALHCSTSNNVCDYCQAATLNFHAANHAQSLLSKGIKDGMDNKWTEIFIQMKIMELVYWLFKVCAHVFSPNLKEDITGKTPTGLFR